jgi:NADP-dependent aldehyde dehydrogenase
VQILVCQTFKSRNKFRTPATILYEEILMTMQPVLIDGKWNQSDAAGSFKAANPTTKTLLPEEYPVSSMAEAEQAIQAAQRAIVELRSKTPNDIANFLETYAAAIEARTDDLVELAYAETALAKSPRLRDVELPRTANQLRQAAAAARNRSWRQATIDTKSNIRSLFGPLDGPVLVFGPNNFPFAFNSVAGGDFAAAIAAGNPVIGKANTGHPGTTKLLAEAALEAIESSGMPRAMVQLIYRLGREDGLKFVSHPHIGATGFTGSQWAGLKLKEAADKAGKPIYLEMSSINPVFVLPGAIEERLEAVAAEFYNSCTLGAGQFCTNPGLVIVLDGERSEAFLRESSRLFKENPAGILLGAAGPKDIAHAIEILQANGAEVVVGGREVEGTGYSFENTLLRVPGEKFIQNPKALQEEAFGPVSLFVFAKDVAQLKKVIVSLGGNLTGCLYTHSQGQDDSIYNEIEPLIRQKVGRLLNDKMPTGVAVVPAMNHGGPYPATGHPGFTAVGIPASLVRFGALHCYDNVRPHRLPPELQDKNPTGQMWRMIDGVWTQADVMS